MTNLMLQNFGSNGIRFRLRSCFRGPGSAMIEGMFRTIIGIAALLTAGFLTGCQTSTTSPVGGSKGQTTTGISSSGYPAGEPKDAGSPALASSTESQYAHVQAEEGPTK